MNEKAKLDFQSAIEEAERNKSTENLLKRIDKLGPPQPLSDLEKGKKPREFPLRSPLYYSQKLLNRIASLPLPTTQVEILEGENTSPDEETDWP